MAVAHFQHGVAGFGHQLRQGDELLAQFGRHSIEARRSHAGLAGDGIAIFVEHDAIGGAQDGVDAVHGLLKLSMARSVLLMMRPS